MTAPVRTAREMRERAAVDVERWIAYYETVPLQHQEHAQQIAAALRAVARDIRSIPTADERPMPTVEEADAIYWHAYNQHGQGGDAHLEAIRAVLALCSGGDEAARLRDENERLILEKAKLQEIIGRLYETNVRPPAALGGGEG